MSRPSEEVHATEATSFAMLRGRRAWGINRGFRGILAATFVSQLGTQVGFLAFPLIATNTLRATALEVSLLYSVGWLPYLLFFAPIGRVVDRRLRVPLMIAADLARCLLVFLLPLSYFLGWLALWQLYLVALAVGVSGALFDIADQTFLPSVVDAQNLLRANVLLETSSSATRIVGPGAAGGVIALIGPPAALIVDGVSYLASAAIINGIRPDETLPNELDSVTAIPVHEKQGGGFGYVLRHPALRALFVSKAVANTGWAFVEALFVVYAVRVIHIDAALLGAIFLAGNAGLLAGTGAARRFTARVGRKQALASGIALQMAGTVALAVAATRVGAVILAAGLAIRAFGLVLYNVNQTTERQTVTPPELLGRVSAVMRVGDVGVLPVGYLVGGVLATAIPLRGVFLIAAAVMGCSFILMNFSRIDAR